MSPAQRLQDFDLVAKVAEVGSSLCTYLPGAGDPEKWPSSRCDCKYGASGVGEQNGCAEMRAVYRMLTEAKLHVWSPRIAGRRAVEKHSDALARLSDGPQDSQQPEEGR